MFMTNVDIASLVGPRLDEVYLAGAWVTGQGGGHEIVSPSTREVVAEVALPSVEQAGSAVAAGLGPLAGKITVITATNDRALELSGRLAGGMTRVGAAEKAAIEQLGVRVIYASDAGWGIINHDLFLSNAAVQKVIRRSIDTAAA